MKLNKKKIGFGRHESFALRYSWLTKGFKSLQQNSNVFVDDDATVTLGVGKNMVSSIRYWLRACQVIDASNKATEIGNMLFDKGGCCTGY